MIYSKIQSIEGLLKLDEIIDISDGIVIARGYLGLCLDREVEIVYI